MNKAVTDFIVYANINLTWFAFNFVLVTLPPVCIYVYDSDFLVMDDRKESYLGIIYTLWITHMVAFLMKMRIYYPKQKEFQTEEDNSDDFIKVVETEESTEHILNRRSFIAPS